MTKVQRQHCRQIRLDATSWRFWLKRCSCCFGTLTRLRFFKCTECEKHSWYFSWKQVHSEVVRAPPRPIPVTCSQLRPILSGHVADRSHRRVRVWVLTVEHGVVDGGEQEVCGQVLSEELQGVQFSQQVSCRETCSRLSIYINDNNHFQTIWTQTDFSEGKTHCSGANKRSVQTPRHSCSDTFVPFTGHTKQLKQPAVFTSWTAALLQCETSRCSFIPAFFWLAATLKTSWALVSQYTESEL